MPKIPTYYAKGRKHTIAGAPIPIGAARSGAEAVGAGMASMGQGLSNLGQAIASVELQKQKIRDDAAIASSVHRENNYVFEESRKLQFKEYLNSGT